jgi:surface polysaccharide O-acyltransferase-like enzyme
MEIKTTHYLNVLRVLALTGVIMGHIFMTICAYFTPVLTGTEVYISTVLRNLWHWCVPLFVMISGVLVLDPQKEISLNKLFKKYILRVMVALFMFGVPYAFAELLVAEHYHFNIKQVGIAFLNVVQGKTDNHLWYLYFVTGLYLITPLIKVFTDNVPKKTLEYILIVLFLFTSIVPLLKTLNNIFSFGVYIPVNSVYVFYFLLGHYIHRYTITINSKILFLVIFCYILYTILMPLNETLVIQSASRRLLSLESDSPIIVLISLALFCLLHQMNRSNKVIDFLSPLCFGIYLIHPLFLFSLYLFLHFTPETYPLVLFISGAIVFTVSLSVAFTYCARRIKIVKKYIL